FQVAVRPARLSLKEEVQRRIARKSSRKWLANQWTIRKDDTYGRPGTLRTWSDFLREPSCPLWLKLLKGINHEGHEVPRRNPIEWQVSQADFSAGVFANRISNTSNPAPTTIALSAILNAGY